MCVYKYIDTVRRALQFFLDYTVNVGPSLIFNNIVALSDNPTFLQMGIVLRTIGENQVPVTSVGHG